MGALGGLVGGWQETNKATRKGQSSLTSPTRNTKKHYYISHASAGSHPSGRCTLSLLQHQTRVTQTHMPVQAAPSLTPPAPLTRAPTRRITLGKTPPGPLAHRDSGSGGSRRSGSARSVRSEESYSADSVASSAEERRRVGVVVLGMVCVCVCAWRGGMQPGCLVVCACEMKRREGGGGVSHESGRGDSRSDELCIAALQCGRVSWPLCSLHSTFPLPLPLPAGRQRWRGGATAAADAGHRLGPQPDTPEALKGRVHRGFWHL